MEFVSDNIFAENFCVPLLRDVQNSDGGWGFQPGAQSRAEPTCWALKALLAREGSHKAEQEAIERGLNFLVAAQLEDGSWPSTPEEKTGCWVTSLVCWVLLLDKDAKKAVAAGLHWLCQDWPSDSTLWRRWLARFSSQRHVAPINDSLRGW